jgi:hypothetical protein
MTIESQAALVDTFQGKPRVFVLNGNWGRRPTLTHKLTKQGKREAGVGKKLAKKFIGWALDRKRTPTILGLSK